MSEKKHKERRRRERAKKEEPKVNKISDVKMAYIMYGKKVFVIPIVIAIILGAVIWGIVYNARKDNEPQETADNEKEQINYIWGEIKPGKKNANNYTMVTSSDGIQVPVPTGYTASSASDENSVRGGFVIYEGTEAVTDSNKWDAQCNRNQYVWIPIADVSDMYWRDQTTGKKYGTRYTFSSSANTKDSTSKREPQTTQYDIQSTNLTKYLNGNYVKESHKLSINETIENEFILGLRKINGISILKFLEKYNFNPLDIDIVKELLKEKFLVIKNNYIKINKQYIYQQNNILYRFLSVDYSKYCKL